MEDTKAQHEKSALEALRDELIARGRTAQITGKPESDPQHPLTVDAIMEIDGREWAVDHCLVSRPSDLPPAMAHAEKHLRPRLEAVADAADCLLVVMFLPQSPSQGPREVENYYKRVVQIAEQSAASGELESDDSGNIVVEIRPSGPGPAVVFMPLQDTTGNAFLGVQVDAGISKAVEKKLTGQLKRAKEAGLLVALLLDQVPRPGSRNTTIWIASVYTLARTIQPLLNQHPCIVDQVWLRPAQAAPPYVAPGMHLLISG